ncbi:MAG: hypothetical protein R3272_15020 [Candidatus Promineifilaceae bacterium]|nr:hypothetical protein [Candidatus Promineifilaceae bacterium]
MPPLADLSSLLLALALLPVLSAQFRQLGFANSLVLGGLFILFALSVTVLRRVAPPAGARLLPGGDRRIWAALGVLFSLFFTTGVLYVSGFLDSVLALGRGLMDEPSVTLYLLLTPASWFAVSLIYMLLLSSETEPSVPRGSARSAVLAFVALVGVNLMAVGATAVWQAALRRFGLAQTDAGLWAVALFFLYLFLFGPPRVLYAARRDRLGAAVAMASFLLFTLALVWLAVS